MFHSLCEQSHETVSINHNFCRQRRAEADRTEVLLLTRLGCCGRCLALEGVWPLFVNREKVYSGCKGGGGRGGRLPCRCVTGTNDARAVIRWVVSAQAFASTGVVKSRSCVVVFPLVRLDNFTITTPRYTYLWHFSLLLPYCLSGC